MVEYFCAALAGVLTVVIAALALKLWHYRAAIIQLQADMTLVLNDLTRPTPHQRFITCNQCDTVLTTDEFSHHACRRVHAHAV